MLVNILLSRKPVFGRMTDERFMEITFLGHASFRLKTSRLTIVTDPFNPDSVGFKFVKTTADVVTVSHQHEDHNFIGGVENVRKIFDAPGEYEVSDVGITGIASFHDEKKGKLRGKNTIFVFEFEEAKLAHLGDLGHKLSDSILDQMGKIDVLLIPVGGVYTINPYTACEIVRQVEPKLVIPMHYKMKGMNENIFGGLANVEEFLKEIGLTVETVDKLNLKKGDLLQDVQKVLLLKPRGQNL